MLPPNFAKVVREPHCWMSIARQGLAVLQTSGWRGLRQVLKYRIRQMQHFSGNYQEWIRRFDTLTDEKRSKIEHRTQKLERKPLISVLMPVFNPPPQFLDKAIQSVRNQIYPHWELCIADDASTDPNVLNIIEHHQARDKRIKVVYRKQNGHISRASNSALGLVSGDFVALLDHDDLLPEQALFWVAHAIQEHPNAGLIYSDEDKIDAAGARFNPYFKCEFNYELLLAQNMICHLSVYRSQLLSALGGFRTGFEGAQDWDLALRAVEQLTPAQIVHIPLILYHWRAITGSTASPIQGKDYAVAAGRKAVMEHLERCTIPAEVLPAPEAPIFNRIRFAHPNPLPLVSIIIPTRDRAALLSRCIHSILERSSYPIYEIIIIDNGSKQADTLKMFERLPKEYIRVARDETPFNFAALNNAGARLARGEVLCLMNNDLEVLTSDWLEEMVSFAVQPDIAAVGARLWYPDGRLQHGGVVLGIGGVAGHCHRNFPRGASGYFGRMILQQSFSAVTAACLVIRRTVFEEVGGLDETFAVAFNDVDFCLRLRKAGYRNVWTPYAELKHHESASRGYEDTPQKRARYEREKCLIMQRWEDRLRLDPAYNPNLTLDREDFSLAWPPRVELMTPNISLSESNRLKIQQ